MREFKCKICNRKFETGESLRQHNIAKHEKQAGDIKRKRSTKGYILLFFVVLIIFIVSATLYIRSQKPGVYDDFAKCLGEKAVIYGNDFCQYTTKQLNMFGNSDEYLNYVKCIENEELCNSKGVKITPTWEINGQMYEGVQEFEKLVAVSGCGI